MRGIIKACPSNTSLPFSPSSEQYRTKGKMVEDEEKRRKRRKDRHTLSNLVPPHGPLHLPRTTQVEENG